MRFTFHPRFVFILLICLGLLLGACKGNTPTLQPTLTSIPTSDATSTLAPSPAPSATAPQPTAVLLASPESDPQLVSSLQTSLNNIVTQAGLRWQVQQKLSSGELTPDLHLVVVVPPDPGLAGLAASAPATKFLAYGIPGVEPAPNLTVISSEAERTDQQGFVAGVIAAMLSNDWRVGVISVGDTAAGRSARSGFLNGVEYFCGLCRPAHPPFYEYPLYVELPAAATSADWLEAANYMVDHYAETVYVFPGAGDEAMFTVLAQAKINIIGSGEPPEAARSSWVVSLSTDPLAVIQTIVEGILNGSLSAGQSLVVPIQFTQVNPALFTPGKQRLAGQVVSDLQAGYIDTGVDLATGELRP